MTTNPQHLVAEFLAADDFSKDSTGALEGALAEFEPTEDEDLQAILDALASYSPGGGDFLYDKEDLKRILNRFLTALAR